jgi:hypothetical protein
MKDLRHRNRGLPLIEVLLLIGILGSLFLMLVPAIQEARESARRTTCMDNMKKWGLAYLHYAQAHRSTLAPSSGVTRDKKGKILAVDGWSWQVLVLPYLEPVPLSNGETLDPKEMYGKLDIANGRPLVEPKEATGTPHADLLATSIPSMLCPSYGGSPYTDFDGGKAAITNYKPLGATHIESLSVASANPIVPKFHPETYEATNGRNFYHPDGGCFPGSNFTFGSFRNGLSNTVFLTESIEPRFARWTVGSDAAIVALPRCVEFESSQVEHDNFGKSKPIPYFFVPKGYGKAIAKSLEAEDTYWSYHTYLDWDYHECPYDAGDGTSGERYGPSANHPSVVVHCFLDGSSRSLNKSIDITLYMTLIRGRGY